MAGMEVAPPKVGIGDGRVVDSSVELSVGQEETWEYNNSNLGTMLLRNGSKYIVLKNESVFRDKWSLVLTC
jgi:hypothetical protein